MHIWVGSYGLYHCLDDQELGHEVGWRCPVFQVVAAPFGGGGGPELA